MTKKKAPRVKAGTSQAAAAERRARFIEAYVANGNNTTQAAIAAGFSPKSAHVQGNRLLKDPRVIAEVDRRRAEVLEKVQEETGITVKRTLQELARIAFINPKALFKDDGSLKPIHELPDDVAAAIASIEVDEIKGGPRGEREVVGQAKKIRLWDKGAAIDRAMKHLGLFEKDNGQTGDAIGKVLAEALDFEAIRAKMARKHGG